MRDDPLGSAWGGPVRCRRVVLDRAWEEQKMNGTVGFGDESKVRDRDELKEIKVKIPISQHIKLHSIRLMMSQTISESVREALTNYFALLKEQQGSEQAADAAVEA